MGNSIRVQTCDETNLLVTITRNSLQVNGKNAFLNHLFTGIRSGVERWYETRNYFSIAFKAFYGVTPSEYGKMDVIK